MNKKKKWKVVFKVTEKHSQEMESCI